MPYNFLSGLDLTGANFGSSPAQIPVNQVTPAPIAQPSFQAPFTNYGSNNYGLGNTGFLSGLDFSSYQNPFQQPVQNAPALAPLAGIPALAPPPAVNQLPPAVNQLPPAVNQTPPPLEVAQTPPPLEVARTPPPLEVASNTSSLYGPGVQTDADGFVVNDGSLPTAYNVRTGKFEPNPYYKGNQSEGSDNPPADQTPAENLAAEALLDGGDANNDGVVDANELDFWRPTDARYGTNPNNGNDFGTGWLDMIRRDGGAPFIGDDNFFSEEEFYAWDQFRQKRAIDGGKEYIGETVEGMPNFVDPNTGETEKPPEEEQDGNWWDTLELSSEGNLFTDPAYQTVALGSVEAIRYKLANEGATEDLANFESWYAANPSGYGSGMWKWFMSGQAGSGPGGVEDGEVIRVLPQPKVAMLGDSSEYEVGPGEGQLQEAVPIPDGGRQATDFGLRAEEEDFFESPSYVPVINPDENPFNTDNRSTERDPQNLTPFQRQRFSDFVAPLPSLPPDMPSPPPYESKARGGVVKPLTGIQTLGR